MTVWLEVGHHRDQADMHSKACHDDLTAAIMGKMPEHLLT